MNTDRSALAHARPARRRPPRIRGLPYQLPAPAAFFADKKDELHDADDDARRAISQAYRDARVGSSFFPAARVILLMRAGAA